MTRPGGKFSSDTASRYLLTLHAANKYASASHKVTPEHLLKEKVPGAGPEFANIKVPDIFYADDVNLMVVNNAKQMQEVLDVLQLFCKLFGMKVNEKKTKELSHHQKGKGITRAPQRGCPKV
jgi:hypothetical protein